MPAGYTHTTRAAGITLTANIYNTDHQNHIDQGPATYDDYSSTVAQMQASTNPGEVGTESQPTSLAGELERIRFTIEEFKSLFATGIAQWYETVLASGVTIPSDFTLSTGLSFGGTVASGAVLSTGLSFGGTLASGGIITGGIILTGSGPASPAADSMYPQSLARSFVIFSGATPTIQKSFNINSVTRTSTGSYKIHMNTGVSGVGVPSIIASVFTSKIVSITATTVEINTFSSDGIGADPRFVSVIIFGNQ